MALRADWKQRVERSGCPVCASLALLCDGATFADAITIAYALGCESSEYLSPFGCRDHLVAISHATEHLRRRG